MACYNPILAFAKVGPTKTLITWQKSDDYKPIPLPCGRCIGCKTDRAKQWAIRITHEASLKNNNMFVTLTYDNEHIKQLPIRKNADGRMEYSLNKTDIKNFVRRLKRCVAVRGGGSRGDSCRSPRYYQAGEYGTINRRPHHHIIIFDFDPGDLELLWNQGGTMLYRSNIIENAWGKGIIAIGQVTVKSAMYVAGYAAKGLTKELDEIDYGNLQKPFSTMSRRPGIGRAWYDIYYGDLFPHDRVITRDGLQRAVPRYYTQLYRDQKPAEYQKIIERRKQKIKNVSRDDLRKADEYAKYQIAHKEKKL